MLELIFPIPYGSSRYDAYLHAAGVPQRRYPANILLMLAVINTFVAKCFSFVKIYTHLQLLRVSNDRAILYTS
jgi:hypothetical protein